jgi:hypothetical protein
LRKQFSQLCQFLEQKGIAHGDIQNGNVLVAGDKLKLIDYDGMFVPSLPLRDGSELGHKHFQHPQRSSSDYGPKMDRFSFIVVDLSLRALSRHKSLYKKFREGGETIIFKANDFADPQNSEIFQILLRDPSLNAAARNLASICEAPISDVPTLEDFCAGRNIPGVKKPIVTAPATASPPKPTRYISAFPVIDAVNFEQGARHIGDKVELIGKIVGVKPGMGKRGPYIFVNFGDWRENIIKLSIWSEGIKTLKEKPSKGWVGRWVSVTGLIGDPYTNHKFKYTHLSVTVEQDGQIQFITEAEARFRLGTGFVSQPGTPPLGKTTEQSKGPTPASKPTASAKPPNAGTSSGPKPSNKDILEKFQKGTTSSPTQPIHLGTTSQPPPVQQPTQKVFPNQPAPPPPPMLGASKWTSYYWFGALIAVAILLVRLLEGASIEKPKDSGVNNNTNFSAPASPPKQSSSVSTPNLTTAGKNATSPSSDTTVLKPNVIPMPPPNRSGQGDASSVWTAPEPPNPQTSSTMLPDPQDGPTSSVGTTPGSPNRQNGSTSSVGTTPPPQAPESGSVSSVGNVDQADPLQQKRGNSPKRDPSRDAFEIQRRLAELGYLDRAPSGMWGARSNDALAAFRTRNGLQPGGGWDYEVEARLFSTQAIHAPPRRPVFVGVWAPDHKNCQDPTNPPILITDKRATSSGGTCEFRTIAQAESGWRIQAECSADGKKWSSDINLSIKGGNLIWSSQKGTATYVRCRSTSTAPKAE